MGKLLRIYIMTYQFRDLELLFIMLLVLQENLSILVFNCITTCNLLFALYIEDLYYTCLFATTLNTLMKEVSKAATSYFLNIAL